jgi:nifR3 family TIM-barrel protein
MKYDFWKKLKKPIFALAPMSNVTDDAFRQMLLILGRSDVFWTEFVSVDGLFSKGKERLLKMLEFDKKEHPIVAQVFGREPELFEKAAVLVRKLGFDGIDINMGCPSGDIQKQGSGAALIKNPKLAKEIIRATLRGAQGKQKNIPVSVKTRLGHKVIDLKWISAILEEKPACLAVHFRTEAEGFKGRAHWEMAGKIIKLRDKVSPETLILGNGDVKSLEEAKKLAKETGVDGVMIGRAAVSNPWFFIGKIPAPPQRLTAIIKHAEIFEKVHKDNVGEKGRIKNFDEIKKFFKSYANGFEGAKELREELFSAKSAKEVKKIITDFKRNKKRSLLY